MEGVRLNVLDHPLIAEYLAILRNAKTGRKEFHSAMRLLGRYSAYEVARTMDTETGSVKTPLGVSRTERLKGPKDLAVILVLRAAIPFVEGVRDVFPESRVGVVSAWRGKPPELSVEVGYLKVPKITSKDTVIVADPMLATGHTLAEVASRVLEGHSPRRLIFMSVLATREGLSLVSARHPKGEFFTCAVDPKLDSRGYIVPGLGDAGDRLFGEPY